MIAKYYLAIRPQTNETHAIHKEGCPFLPDNNMRIYLGMFDSVQDAGKESQRYFSRTNNCLFCSKNIQHKKEQPVYSEIELAETIPLNNQISLSVMDGSYYFLN